MVCIQTVQFDEGVRSMKKRIRDIVIAVIVFAMVCFVFWKIAWITSWKEVVFLYAVLAIVIAISIMTVAIKKKFGKLESNEGA